MVLSVAMAGRAELPEVLTSYAEMGDRLDAATDHPSITTELIGRSVEGKDLVAVRVSPKQRMAIRWKVLFIGAQHGDEHAGKEAILELIDDLASGEEQLPAGVELWAVPMANPDGVDRDERRNANDFDLNRDHLILSQPETVALHRLTQRERPHVIVDCHEFTRDSKSYIDKGWGEWPLIMMDGANSPLLPSDVLMTPRMWPSTNATQAIREAGVNYQRYIVGGPPPWREVRYSTLDADDARNGMSFYGGVGFIIESGIKRSADDPQADLDDRVAAYRLLLADFLGPNASIENAIGQLPPGEDLDDWRDHGVVTNAFWGRTQRRGQNMLVIDLATGKDRAVRANNFAGQVVYKTKVAVPIAYAVLPEHADVYAELLDKHAVTYARLDEARAGSVEITELERMEEDFDPIYERYGGRQIVTVETADTYELPAGSLWIDLAALAEQEPMMARRAIKVLEPQQLYGLYQWTRWRDTVAEDGTIPVVRVMPE